MARKKDLLKEALLVAEEVERATVENAKDLVTETFAPKLEKFIRDSLNTSVNEDDEEFEKGSGLEDGDEEIKEDWNSGPYMTRRERKVKTNDINKPSSRGLSEEEGLEDPEWAPSPPVEDEITDAAPGGNNQVNDRAYGKDGKPFVTTEDEEMDDLDTDDEDIEGEFSDAPDDELGEDEEVSLDDDDDEMTSDDDDISLDDAEAEEDSTSPPENEPDLEPEDEDDVFEDEGIPSDEEDGDEVLEIPDELFDDEEGSEGNEEDPAMTPDEDGSDLGDDELDLGDETEDEELEEGTLYVNKGGKMRKVTPTSYYEGRIRELEETRDKLSKAVTYLRSQLSETTLFNAKLAHLNKLYESGMFSKNEKLEIASRLDRAKNVAQTQTIYKNIVKETLNKNPLDNLHEAIRDRGSYAVKPTKTKSENIYESDEVKRMLELAGVLKG